MTMAKHVYNAGLTHTWTIQIATMSIPSGRFLSLNIAAQILEMGHDSSLAQCNDVIFKAAIATRTALKPPVPRYIGECLIIIYFCCTIQSRRRLEISVLHFN